MLDFQSGQTLLFDKPKGWTSFDVVKKIRGTIRIKKVGHAGTLDPLASGLLILCTGKHTKQIESIQGAEKGYETIFKLGATTPSYDAEHPEENLIDANHITRGQIEAALPTFRGEIKQYPPVFSAVKIDGKRAYKSARKGKEVALRPRLVQVYQFDLVEDPAVEPPEYKAIIRCGKGTYIRSLVHDLGQTLGVGAYIRELRRTFIGPHHVDQAWDIQDFVDKVRAARAAMKEAPDREE